MGFSFFLQCRPALAIGQVDTVSVRSRRGICRRYSILNGQVRTGGHMSRRRLRCFLFAVVLALLPAFKASAGTSSTTFGVSMAVARNCKIATTGTYNFGAYDPVVANASSSLQVTSANFISVNCNKNTSSVWVGLDAGTHSGHAPSGSTRAASDGNGNYIGYDFYQDSAFTTLWGNTASTAPTLGPFNSSKTAVTANVYGQAPGGQDVPVGTYTDTITATVNF